MKLYHPTLLKYLILPIFIFMLCGGYVPLILLLSKFSSLSLVKFITYFCGTLIFAILCTYLFIKGYALFKYRNVSIEIDSESKLKVISGSESMVLENSEVFYKNYKMLAMIEFFNEKGEKIASFDYAYPNAKDFVKYAESHLTVISAHAKSRVAN